MDRLPGRLEPALEQLLGEELVVAEPELAWRFFDPLCERLPHWTYGRLKAADLGLQRGELERCQQLLEGASKEQWQLAWFHDIAARLALAQNNVAAALSAWRLAIERCQADGSNPSEAAVVEIFRQRAREARRGPGVTEARSLLNGGESKAALALLETLLQGDPQWPPLRHLMEQTRQTTNPSAEHLAGCRAPVAGELQQLELRLRLLAERGGLAWPPPAAPPESPARAWNADAYERFLQTAFGRVALLG
jgi:hypothetical protein